MSIGKTVGIEVLGLRTCAENLGNF